MNTDLRLSVADYERMVAKGAFDELTQRIELIGGAIKSMNPAGPVHDDIIEYLTRWSIKSTDEKLVGVRVQSGLDLSDFESRPEPDLVWVKAGRYLRGHPRAEQVLLLIEVADSSLAFDISVKADLYAQAAIPEYWVVDTNAEEVRVHRTPWEGRYKEITTFAAADKISPQCLALATLDLYMLFGGTGGK